LVLFDDLLWKDADRDAHVFVARHRGVEIEVFDIPAHETGAGSGSDAVEEDFGSSHIGRRCADIARVVDEVAAGGEADPVRFGLLRANGGDNSSVGDLAVRRYLFTLDEVNVSVPVGIRVPTPWARRPISLAKPWIHLSMVGP
jgi:hypothetical protein